jgi:3-phenylpropionate/trans-cinnamate dioxygenase ferredoxin component
MTGFVEVATTDELENGTIKKFTLEGDREIMLARVGDEYFASDCYCPHMGGHLWQGKLEGTVLTCPRHHSQFDLTDGHVIRWTDFTGIKKSFTTLFKSPRPLKTYQIRVEGGKVLVDL